MGGIRILLLFLLVAQLAACARPGERAITVWGGRYYENHLLEDLVLLQDFDPKDSYLGAVGYSQHLTHGESARWELEGQAVQHIGRLQDHQEFNLVLVLRWLRFPWNHRLRTSMAIGEGLSYAVELPAFEDQLARDQGKGGTAQWLNYLLLEWTVGLPSQPRLDYLVRLHHRSGVFGLFSDVTEGSNFITVGLRFTF